MGHSDLPSSRASFSPQAESERDRAERERTELQTRWREQTEEWFRKGDIYV